MIDRHGFGPAPSLPWLVRKMPDGVRPWAAGPVGCHGGPACPCRSFPSHAAAVAYADRMARGLGPHPVRRAVGDTPAAAGPQRTAVDEPVDRTDQHTTTTVELGFVVGVDHRHHGTVT